MNELVHYQEILNFSDKCRYSQHTYCEYELLWIISSYVTILGYVYLNNYDEVHNKNTDSVKVWISIQLQYRLV